MTRIAQRIGKRLSPLPATVLIYRHAKKYSAYRVRLPLVTRLRLVTHCLAGSACSDARTPHRACRPSLTAGPYALQSGPSSPHSFKTSPPAPVTITPPPARTRSSRSRRSGIRRRRSGSSRVSRVVLFEAEPRGPWVPRQSLGTRFMPPHV